MSCLVIAEAGVNHNGDVALAHRLIDVAADCRADAVKFQTFRAADLVTRAAPRAAYQADNTGSADGQQDMLAALELPFAAHAELKRHCQERGIAFMSTAFESASLRFLVEEVGIDVLKCPSGELTNGPLLLQMARTGKPVILSTGMAELDEIAQALAVLAAGMAGNDAPDAATLATPLDPAAQALLAERVTLLHCTTEYPTPPADVNLRAMLTLAETFGVPVGFSDHSSGITAAIAATALGARVIEKHFTLDRALPGPDHKASLQPDELARMIAEIRLTETMLGSGIKRPADSERKNAPIARKSLVALAPVAKGEAFTAANLGVKRPGTGISPMRYWDMLGQRAIRDFAADEVIEA